MTINTLVGIPCLYGMRHTREAIDSVLSANTNLLLISNGCEPDMLEMLKEYSTKENVFLIENPKNIYVNPAWNQIIKFAIDNKYERLCIMNSDLVLHPDWIKVLDEVKRDYPMVIPCPSWCEVLKFPKIDTLEIKLTPISGGVPGVFIVLDETQMKFVYPIPEGIKVWFGDNWVYELCRKLGYQQCIVEGLYAHHYTSQNVSKVANISEIIEQDKIEWEIIKASI